MNEPIVKKQVRGQHDGRATGDEHNLASTPDDSQHVGEEQREEVAQIDYGETESSDDDSDISYETFEDVARRNMSLVEFYGLCPGDCGYCKQNNQGRDGRQSYGMIAHKLKACEYQDLLDRNCRRSGKYCYQPRNATTCCPNYPIICDAQNFKLTRSHRKCIERLNNYLLTGALQKGESKPNYNGARFLHFEQKKTPAERKKSFHELKASSKSKDRRYVAACEKKVGQKGISLIEAISEVRDKWDKRRKKVLPLEAYLHPVRPNVSSSDNKSLSSFVESKHKLSIKMCHVKSSESKALRCEEHKILERYQASVHKESAEDWSMNRFRDFLVQSPITPQRLTDYDYLPDTTDSSSALDMASELGQLSTKVDCDTNDNLLVEPPNLPNAYGTYHCSYHMDGKLIAVGVLDVLPRCITTVYFFYDPAYEHLNMGIYSALIEISMIRRMYKHFNGLPSANKLIWYSIGFYVPTCKKMHYKTRFRPSFLLCSESFKYVPIETCLRKLATTKYARFYDNESNDGEEDSHQSQVQRFTRIPLVSPVTKYSGSPLEYLTWLRHNLSEESCELFWNRILEPYICVIGYPLSELLCLKVNTIHSKLVDLQRQRRQSSHTNLER